MNESIYQKEIDALNSVAFRGHEIFFDIGCNYGDYTEQIITAMDDRPYTIFCFEPVKDFYNAEVERFKGNPSVKLNNIALSDIEGDISFCRIKSPNHGMEGCSSFILRPEFKTNKWPYSMITVKSSTVDRYMSSYNISYVDWMKIDVEGAELAVLKGAHDALRKGKIGRIQFEYGTTFIDAGISVKNIIDFVFEYGYELCDFVNGRFVEMPGFVEDYAFNNYYLIRRDLL